MSQLDPEVVFTMIASQLPEALHPHVLVIGSLAAAYHYRERLGGTAVTTKDADVVVQPAGAITECKVIAERLFELGWRPREGCVPQHSHEDADALSVMRLHPPECDAFFLELLAFPPSEQTSAKVMLPFELKDGWYALPSFRHLRLVSRNQRTATSGLRYAAPEMMALSNLLSHGEIGTRRVSEPIEGRTVLRAAKDLGRVLALARLATRSETESWITPWTNALKALYPADNAKHLAKHAGDGLRALMGDLDALDDAHFTADIGLLRGLSVTADQLRAVGAQLFVDVLEPFAAQFAELEDQ